MVSGGRKKQKVDLVAQDRRVATNRKGEDREHNSFRGKICLDFTMLSF